MDACPRQWVTITQNLLCRTPSSHQEKLLLASRKTGFIEGNLGHTHIWGWGRGGEGDCGRSPKSRRRGKVAGQSQTRGQGSVAVQVRGLAGCPCIPRSITALNSHHLTSPCKCQHVSFYKSFIMHLLEVLHTYVSLEITVVVMPRKLHKQFLLKANI